MSYQYNYRDKPYGHSAAIQDKKVIDFIAQFEPDFSKVLSKQIDKDKLVSGMKIGRQWINTKAMQNIRGKELAPGPNMIDDNDLLEWVKETAETTYHPVGTCKMGQDKMSVVNEELIVKSFKNLRVVDASIMPTLTSGNTNAPTIMIAEKASDLILSKWSRN